VGGCGAKQGLSVSKPLRETGKGEAMERGNNPSTVPRTLPSLQHYRSEIITTHPLLLVGAVGRARKTDSYGCRA
jgi:hypothetical protein